MAHKSLKEAKNTWKCTFKNGVCLCTMKELENFLNSPKKTRQTTSADLATIDDLSQH